MKFDFIVQSLKTFNILRIVLSNVNSVVRGQYCAISIEISVESIEQICGKYCAIFNKYSVDSPWILLSNNSFVFCGEYCAKSTEFSVHNIYIHIH
jgi:hypothetical protein